MLQAFESVSGLKINLSKSGMQGLNFDYGVTSNYVSLSVVLSH